MSRIAAAFRRSATSLRIARRDLRSRPGNFALVVSMVALPVAIVMAVGVVNASGQPTRAELVASELGQNEAWVTGVGPSGSQVFQSAEDPSQLSVVGGDDEDTADPTTRDPRPLLPSGAQVTPISRVTAVASKGSAAARVPVTLGPLWGPEFEGKTSTLEGHAPHASDEVMVSPGLVERFGLKVGDSLSVGDAQVHIVGVLGAARGWDDGAVFGSADLDVGIPPGGATWYVKGPALTEDDVSALTSDGFAVFTREGVAAPTLEGASGGSSAAAGMILGGGLGLIEVVLLAGAAFAVSMRRRQHTLALIAATGAERRELTGIGLASGAWHGLGAGAVGVPLGMLAAWAFIGAQLHWGGAEGQSAVWGYHVVWWHMAAAVGFGVLAALLASFIPALTSSGVDVIAALRGSQRPRSPKAWPGYVGAALVVASAGMFVVAAHLTDSVLDHPSGEASSPARLTATVAQLTAVALAFVGVLMALPRLLGWMARVGSWLGLGARIAARDAARSPGRTVPVIAAIAVTVTLGATTYLTEARYEQDFQKDLVHQVPLGVGQIYLAQWGDSDTPTYLDPAVFEADLSRIIPAATFHPMNMWQNPWDGAPGPYYAVTVPPQNVCLENRANADGTVPNPTMRQIAEDPNCADPVGTDVTLVATGDAALLALLLGHEPSEAALDALDSGGLVSFFPQLVVDGKASVANWDGGITRTDGFTLDAVTEVPTDRSSLALAMVSPETAAAHGIVTEPSMLLVTKPGGLTQADGDAANAVLVAHDVSMVVQWPFGEYADVIAASSLIAVALIALFATGLALGLARAEARRDDFTLASLGASPALAKRVSGWQAALSVFLALVIGLGVALAEDWARSHEYYGATFAPPWWQLGVALLALPALVGVACGIFTRAPKALHYRLAA
jgi:hypothetical protein